VETIEQGAEFFLFYHKAGHERNIPEKEICEEFVTTDDESTQDSTKMVVATSEESQLRQSQKGALDSVPANADPKHDLIRIVPHVTKTSTTVSERQRQPTTGLTGDGDLDNRQLFQKPRSGGYEAGDREYRRQSKSSRSGAYVAGDRNVPLQSQKPRSGGSEVSDRDTAHTPLRPTSDRTTTSSLVLYEDPKP
jgi:hypothetical protein